LPPGKSLSNSPIFLSKAPQRSSFGVLVVFARLFTHHLSIRRQSTLLDTVLLPAATANTTA
jgi:hypothetical protein